MLQIPEPLRPLTEYNQFVLRNTNKLPINHRTMKVGNAHDKALWLDAATAIELAEPRFEIGFVLTKDDPFFFVDLDNCLNDAGWSDVANEILYLLPDAAVEISQSGKGLHIIGKGKCPEHSCKNINLNIEFYTQGRMIALTGDKVTGCSNTNLTEYLPKLVSKYFPPKKSTLISEWTSNSVSEWNGIIDDDKLIEIALASKTSFKDLWQANEEVLSKNYIDNSRAYDESSADAALAQHLAFWTGNNCERMLALMWRSGLVRDKWSREDYLKRTIINACSLQEVFYTGKKDTDLIAEVMGAPELKAKSDNQRNYANSIRSEKLKECQGEEESIKELCNITSAKFWIDNKDKSVDDIVTMVTPTKEILSNTDKSPKRAVGFQYLDANMQEKHFESCVYVRDVHRVFVPDGALLKPEQFNAMYGGYLFQMDEGGSKTTKKAWEAFTESQIVRYAKAASTCFKPEVTPGELVEQNGIVSVNVYVPVKTPRKKGDHTLFLKHLDKILPDKKDRDIMLSYMAACLQYKGVKFQWAPLLQGVEGNGKTLLTRCIIFAIGKKHTYLPKASDIDNKFNGWLLNKIFIGVEDIYVPDNRNAILEILKPMITSGDGLEIQMKGVDQFTTDICANFMFNSNHKDAIRKSRNDRRFAIFFTAQQSSKDLLRDGMDGDYFHNLYTWLEEDGYAIVANYLESYDIPDELNPATRCKRAPETSSTKEAIGVSLGAVEQEIMEAIEEGRQGFSNGWVSSIAIENLLKDSRMNRVISHNKRRDIMRSLGYDWHPALSLGRTSAPIPMDGNKRPRLYIKDGHPDRDLESPSRVSGRYEQAQRISSTSETY